MTEISSYSGGRRRTIGYKADVPMHVKPKVVNTEYRDGIRIHISEDGRVHIADQYDRVWNPPKLAILPTKRMQQQSLKTAR